jgi:hypothetical protein
MSFASLQRHSNEVLTYKSSISRTQTVKSLSAVEEFDPSTVPLSPLCDQKDWR